MLSPDPLISAISVEGEQSPLNYYLDKKITISEDGTMVFEPMSDYTIDFGNPITAIFNINERLWDAGTNSVEQIVGSAKSDIIPFTVGDKTYILRTTTNSMGRESETGHVTKVADDIGGVIGLVSEEAGNEISIWLKDNVVGHGDIPNTSTKDGERTPRSNITQTIYSVDEVVKTDKGIKLVPLNNGVNEDNKPNIELEYNLTKR